MSDNWDDIPKIKIDSTDFNNNYADNEYKTEEHAAFNDIKSDSTEGYLSVDFEKPDEVKIKNIVLLLSIIFFIVVIPIIYHNVKNYMQFMKMMGNKQPLEVVVSHMQPKDLYDTSEVTGIVTPESSVDVVARVDGYLEHTYFKEGDFVKKGQVLFKIEPNEYQIAVRAADAAVAQAKAVYTNSMQELERAKELIKENFISRSDYDAIVASARSSEAALDEVKQNLARAKLNLAYTNITSPLTGKAGKILLTDGNYVGLGSGALVNIAKTDPICVSFSLKSSDVLKMKRSNNGLLDLTSAKVELQLSDDSRYNKIGKIVFSDNVVSSEAASLSLKALFDNPDNILVPGDYVRVTVTSSEPHKRIVVPQSITYGDALNGYYLWVIEDGKTRKKRITVNGINDNNWIVENGINEHDNVVINSNIPIEMEFVSAKIQNEEKSEKENSK